jgi:hypothetical protein
MEELKQKRNKIPEAGEWLKMYILILENIADVRETT